MRKSKNNKGFGDEVFMGVLGISALLIFAGFGLGRQSLNEQMKVLKGEAVTRNYAEWATEAKTGEVSFRWKENSK